MGLQQVFVMGLSEKLLDVKTARFCGKVLFECDL